MSRSAWGAMDAETPGYHDLRQYLSILKLRRWTLVAATVAGIVLALFMSSRQTPIYSTGGELQVKPSEATGFSSAENEAAVVRSAPVAQLVAEDLGFEESPVALLGPLSAEPVSPTSNQILISYSGTDPAFVRDAANSFMDSYISYRRGQARTDIAATRRQLEQKRERQRARLAAVSEQIERARNRGNTGRLGALETQRSILAANLGLTQQEIDGLEPVPARASIAEILKPAPLPQSPSSPDHRRSALMGLLGGLALGVAIAFLRERLDDRFRGRPDLERALEAPVLATVPRFLGKVEGQRGLSLNLDPGGAASEAYRTLRTALQFICAQRNIKSILVSSPSAHEGKTSTVANLGVAISSAGLNVALVSADLRRPQLERHFDVKASQGLTTWLLGEQNDLGQLLLTHPDIPGLSLLPAGPIPSNPAELLTSPRLRELVEGLEEMVDLVLVDSPPVLPVADASIIASLIGPTVLIVDAARTRRSAAVHAKEQIERVGGTLLGTVLNGFDPASTPYYYEPYYYTKYYDSNVQTGGEDDRPEIVDARDAEKSRAGRSGE